MGVITIRNVAKQFDTQVVLRDLSLDLHGEETVGLVGANGSGKTTLLRLLAGVLEPDQGGIVRSKGVEIGYLPQEPQVDLNRTLHEEVGSAFDDLLALEAKIHVLSEQLSVEHEGPGAGELMKRIDRLTVQFESSGGYTFAQRLNEIIAGLGFTKADHALPMSALSGGQKCRAALAKLLLKQSTFLLLDEPTNHLDIHAVRWLEGFLSEHKGGAVIVSHDRYLLDRVVDRIVELDRSGVTGYPGGYTNYVEAKELRRLTQDRRYSKDKEFIEKERAFINKHLAGQRTKEAQGRRTRLERRLASGEFVLEKPSATRRTRFTFSNVQTEDPTALRVDDLAKSYGEKKLFTGLTFQVFAKECFAITGPNGTGKSTLLKIILGQVEADDGGITFGRKIVPGYYAQESGDLKLTHTVLEEMRIAYPALSEHEARSLAARFNFTGDDVFKRISLLSGGEQSRLRLLKLILSAPNVLVLDEPTNHLDIPSCEALEDALTRYPGTIIVVSHDRYFLDRVAGRLLVLERDGHAVYGGNYSYYVEQTEVAKAKAQPIATATATAPKRRQPKRPKGPSETARFDRLSIEEIEDYIIEREDRVALLEERFGDARICRDPAALTDLRMQIEEIKADLAVAEYCWNERTEQ